MPSVAVEDYLKTIFLLSREEQAAGTSSIAERLNVAAGSVTGMLKRLAERGLVEHVPYYGARLTAMHGAEALFRPFHCHVACGPGARSPFIHRSGSAAS